MEDKRFLDALNSTVEIDLSVRGRRSGKSTSRPVWFILENGKLLLLPMAGSDTEWYKNVLQNSDVVMSVKGAQLSAHAKPIIDSARVAEVVDRFRSKHGADDVKKYYSKLDVAVEVLL
jgi:hypothetical protein